MQAYPYCFSVSLQAPLVFHTNPNSRAEADGLGRPLLALMSANDIGLKNESPTSKDGSVQG